jgi:hypothetical protein
MLRTWVPKQMKKQKSQVGAAWDLPKLGVF